MPGDADLPRPAIPPDVPVSVHGTAVALDTSADAACGLLLLGPAGAGKSTLAAELMVLGWTLVADDLVRLTRCRRAGLVVEAPRAAPAIELRGIGPVRPEADRCGPSATLGAALWMGATGPRLPPPETWPEAGDVPLWRHRHAAGLAAKLTIAWRSTPL